MSNLEIHCFYDRGHCEHELGSLNWISIHLHMKFFLVTIILALFKYANTNFVQYFMRGIKHASTRFNTIKLLHTNLKSNDLFL